MLTDQPPVFVSAGGLLPECDFLGNRLQDLMSDGDLEGIYISAVTSGAGGAVVFSWLAGAVSPRALVDSLRALDSSLVPDALTRFHFEFGENVCINPDWWEGLSEGDRAALINRHLNGLLPHVPHSVDCLTDDGLRVTPWTVSGWLP